MLFLYKHTENDKYHIYKLNKSASEYYLLIIVLLITIAFIFNNVIMWSISFLIIVSFHIVESLFIIIIYLNARIKIKKFITTTKGLDYFTFLDSQIKIEK